MLSLKLPCRFAVTLATIALPAAAFAVPVQNYSATLSPLNSSGVNGLAQLSLNTDANTLEVHVHATGLEAGKPHPLHIHGKFESDGTTAADSTTPTIADDSDSDGYVEFMEALPSYGPVILPLTTPPGGTALGGPFPTANSSGVLDYMETFNLSDPSVFSDSYTESNLLPLSFREIVIHGLTLNDDQGTSPGEADGSAGYKAVLPVASGQIQAVPEPGNLVMLGIGVIALGGLAATRRSPAA